MTTPVFATTSSRRALTAAILAVTLALGVAGCSDDDKDQNPVAPNTNSTILTGTFTGANENGRLGLTISSASLAHALDSPAATVVGTAVLAADAGSTVNLSGSYNPASDSLFVTGSGYTLVGKLLANGFTPVISGVYVGPNGTGNFEVVQGSQAEVGVYCGTYLNSSLVQQGRWNLLLFQNHVIGLHSPANGGFIRMTGQATGTSTTKTFTLTADPQYGTMTATGTVNTQDHHASGAWTTPSETGTWTAEYCENGVEGGPDVDARVAP